MLALEGSAVIQNVNRALTGDGTGDDTGSGVAPVVGAAKGAGVSGNIGEGVS